MSQYSACKFILFIREIFTKCLLRTHKGKGRAQNGQNRSLSPGGKEVTLTRRRHSMLEGETCYEGQCTGQGECREAGRQPRPEVTREG